MGKARTVLECTACGHRLSQWAGRCPGCGAWGSIEEVSQAMAAPGVAAAVEPLEDGDEPARLGTGFQGVDRVLGGGMVPGAVVLLAGEPGIGKSTLLLQVLAALSGQGRTCLYASGEETRAQVAARARRLGLPAGASSFVPGRELPAVLDAAATVRPRVLVVDSIQAIRDPGSASLPGGTAQVRMCTDALVGMAKRDQVAVIVAGQVTKDGDVAGPRTLEHAVDVVCAFDGDPRTGLRVLSGGKNRYGPEGEVAWFEMGASGLSEVDPAGVLAPSEGEPGAATALVTAGRRGLAVEIQALAANTGGPPRRHVSGLDPRRFGVVAAVTDGVMGLGLARVEVYGAAAGGLRVDDPGADLAVAAALASGSVGVAPPPGSAFVGEVSLTGAVRPVSGMGPRLAAAAAAGVRTVFCPPTPDAPPGLALVPVRRLVDALAWCRKGSARSRPAAAASAVSGEMAS